MYNCYSPFYYKWKSHKAMCYAVLCCHVWLFVTLWAVAFQAPLSMEILQERILEWVAMPSSRGSSQPRGQTQVFHIAGGLFTRWGSPHAIVDAYNILIPYPVISQTRFQLAYLVLKGSESSLVLHISACCSFPLTFTVGHGNTERYLENILSPLCPTV